MTNLNFIEGFHPESRIWIYQSSREFMNSEIEKINILINEFTKSWTAHKQELKATGKVVMNRFIFLVADETQASASGCSIDSSVKFIRELENQFQTSLLDRGKMLFEAGGRLIEIPFNELENKIEASAISGEDFYFNNSITRLNELQSWKLKVKDSWIAVRMKTKIVQTIK